MINQDLNLIIKILHNMNSSMLTHKIYGQLFHRGIPFDVFIFGWQISLDSLIEIFVPLIVFLNNLI